MKSRDLISIQAPLKEQYKMVPESALVTLEAEGSIGEGISCSIETGKALAKAGLHPATGGDGLLACSGDMLLEALVACAGVTFNAVATAIGLEFEQGRVHAEGDLDFRGTLGVSKDAPVGFRSIRLNISFQAEIDPEQLDRLKELTERYCVVYQTLCGGVDVETTVQER